MKIIILFLISFSVFAGGRHDHDDDIEIEVINNYHETINNYYDVTKEYYSTTEVTEINEYSNNLDQSRGIAIAIASNHPLDYLTYDWQGSINAARYEGESGFSFGFAKRFKSVDALFHATHGRSGNHKASSIGIVWRY